MPTFNTSNQGRGKIFESQGRILGILQNMYYKLRLRLRRVCSFHQGRGMVPESQGRKLDLKNYKLRLG
jgi:hypothetical protein